MRVTHIGIDAGCFPVLDGLAARGLMPAWSAIRSDGGRCVLRSTTPWFTVPGWVSLMTGMPPEQHGLISWTRATPRGYWRRERDRFVSSADVRFPTIFDLASSNGLRVATINMPVTFPPRPLNGVVVAGFPAPLDPARVVQPAGALERYPGYGVDVEAGPADVPDDEREERTRSYADRLAAMAAVRANVAIDQIREGADLVSVVFVGTDRISHVAWPAEAEAIAGRLERGSAVAVADYHRCLDEAIARIVAAARDRGDVVLITSDHGHGAPAPNVFAVNAWLRSRGLLSGGRPGVRRLARLVPGRVRRAAWMRVRDRVRRRPLHSAPFVNWDRTVAYGYAFPHCGLVGIALREPSPGARVSLSEALLAVEAPGGGRIVERVVEPRSRCAPEAAERFPDVLAFLAPGWGATSALGADVVERAPSASADHTPEGILVAVGPGVEPGEHEARDICEIAPTILGALGVGVPAAVRAGAIPWIAGTTSPSALEPDAATEPAPGLTPEEEEQVAQQLRGLGYLE